MLTFVDINFILFRVVYISTWKKYAPEKRRRNGHCSLGFLNTFAVFTFAKHESYGAAFRYQSFHCHSPCC